MDLKALKFQIETSQEISTNNLYNYEIFKRTSWFLSLEDVLILGATCRILNEYVQVSNYFYIDRNIINSLPRNTINNFQMINLKQHLNLIIQIQLKEIRLVWQISILTLQIVKLVNMNGRKTIKIPFSLCESVFPKPILKRETIGLYCESEFQIMLAQRLELEQKGFDRLFDFQLISNELMNNLKQNKQFVINQMCEKLENSEAFKSKFLIYRWNLQDESSGLQQFPHSQVESQSIQIEEQEEEEAFTDEFCIMNLFEQLYSSIECYLQGLSMYFSTFITTNSTNSIDLLSEYNMYWEAYSNSMVELNGVIYPFENIVNEIHQKVFPQYPQYPRFSVWRIMCKLWIKHIIRNDQFQQLLIECFIKTLQAERQAKFLKEFDQGVNNNLGFTPSFQITYEIYDNFLLKQKNSIKDQFQIEYSHKYYTEIVELMRNFNKSIQDLSINEVSVHWIGHVDCCYEEFYDLLSERVQHETSLYYDETKQVFGSNVASFIEFMKFDKEFISQFLPEPLIFKIDNLQREHIFTYLFYYLEHSYLQKFIQIHKDMIALAYNTKTPKQERTSVTSSNNNEYLDTQGDATLNDAQRFLNFALENSNFDLDELLINKKNQNQQEPLLEIIKVALSQKNLEQLVGTNDQEDQQQSQFQFEQNRQQKFPRTYSNNKLNSDSTEVPEEIIKSAKQFLLNDPEFTKLYQIFIDYTKNFDRSWVQVGQKNQDIEILNNDREIPRVLQDYLQYFYFVSKHLTLTILEDNKIVNEEDLDDLEMPPSLSKNSSKFKKNSVCMEVYYSEEEDENQG
ncbi:unnamed protein product (macronuclear) [Paramecium tetraurelia]|uniref:RGS domain-containing protein n=1 Tax=Paramecium tetraurelia TaxID=5888 RepID=A0CGT0_PARTE|nr:uncharacterized protein GSPATT00007437001 [Paramecium tetraurelia]CAK69997.1 unnamed protein product [Paramecium tetraurelia]|eukprot:XP_001437394.1 hypothetical protein (macronuclear) [Paramecium tetraurelia strain d4-2]